MQHPSYSPTPPNHTTSSPSSAPDDGEEDVERLREERALLWSKLEQVAEVIGSDDPLRVVHDVRNIMNELVLLRKLVELDEED